MVFESKGSSRPKSILGDVGPKSAESGVVNITNYDVWDHNKVISMFKPTQMKLEKIFGPKEHWKTAFSPVFGFWTQECPPKKDPPQQLHQERVQYHQNGEKNIGKVGLNW